MPEDIAITSSKSDVDPCSHGQETDRQKSADGRTDRQTAFQLYIVDCILCALGLSYQMGLNGENGVQNIRGEKSHSFQYLLLYTV